MAVVTNVKASILWVLHVLFAQVHSQIPEYFIKVFQVLNVYPVQTLQVLMV